MGYTTDFEGRFVLNRPLEQKHADYIRKFSDTRRMKRDARKTCRRPDPIRKAVGLPTGKEGAYFVGAGDYAGQERTPDIRSYNDPPTGQPGLWCQWVPTEDLKGIEWDGGEKFYHYKEWLEYIIKHFLKPWGYVLNGRVRWQGEQISDVGVLVVEENKVRTFEIEKGDLGDENERDFLERAVTISKLNNSISELHSVGLSYEVMCLCLGGEAEFLKQAEEALHDLENDEILEKCSGLVVELTFLISEARDQGISDDQLRRLIDDNF